jgi:hypothetical protein
MTTESPPAAAAYVRSINDHDAAAFIALFADSAVVNDAGQEFRGLAPVFVTTSRTFMRGSPPSYGLQV